MIIQVSPVSAIRIPNWEGFFDDSIIEISVDNWHNWHLCEDMYDYIKYLLMTSISPMHGLVSGCTTLTITGSNLKHLSTANYSCCIIQWIFEINYKSDYTTHYTPEYWEKSVIVEISPNCGSEWIDYTNHNFYFIISI